MAHPRKRIREAFRARLADSVDGEYRTAAQSRVYASRMAPVNEEELKEDGPAILVYARMEKYNPEKDYGVEGDATYIEREVTLVTEAMLLGGETVDDKLDDIAAGKTLPCPARIESQIIRFRCRYRAMASASLGWHGKALAKPTKDHPSSGTLRNAALASHCDMTFLRIG